eukprot:1590198-Amphidinium_carterae.1
MNIVSSRRPPEELQVSKRKEANHPPHAFSLLRSGLVRGRCGLIHVSNCVSTTAVPSEAPKSPLLTETRQTVS